MSASGRRDPPKSLHGDNVGNARTVSALEASQAEAPQAKPLDPETPAARLRVVVLGPAGSGKTTVGEKLARALGVPFFDADDHHSEAAVAKMQSGVGLTDADRGPWLTRLARLLEDAEATGAVLACSALKASYRETLRAGAADVTFVYLKVSPAELLSRLGARAEHFAGAALLQSQLATLEPPKSALTVSGEQAPDVIIQEILAALS